MANPFHHRMFGVFMLAEESEKFIKENEDFAYRGVHNEEYRKKIPKLKDDYIHMHEIQMSEYMIVIQKRPAPNEFVTCLGTVENLMASLLFIKLEELRNELT